MTKEREDLDESSSTYFEVLIGGARLWRDPEFPEPKWKFSLLLPNGLKFPFHNTENARNYWEHLRNSERHRFVLASFRKPIED